jgi:hypothetical protein
VRRDGSIGISTGYGQDGRGLIPGRGKRFSHLCIVHTGSGDHLVSHIIGTGGSFPQGKAAGAYEADQSPLSSAEDMNSGAIPPLPVRVHGVMLN